MKIPVTSPIAFAVLMLVIAHAAIATHYTEKAETGAKPIQGEKSPCYNGIKDTGEEGIDCGGPCIRASAPETCDSEDNNKDCLIDENEVCAKNNEQNTVTANNVPADTGNNASNNSSTTYPAQPGTLSTPLPDEPAAEPSAGATGNPETYPAPANEYPAEEAPPASQDPSGVDKLTDAEIASYIEKNIGAQAFHDIRELAANNSIHIPEEETDIEVGVKYMRFIWKHSDTLKSKLEGADASHEEKINVLRQFSTETYPEKKAQAESLLEKLANFFRKIFG